MERGRNYKKKNAALKKAIGLLLHLLRSNSPCMEHWNNNHQIFSPVAKVGTQKIGYWKAPNSIEFFLWILGYSCLVQMGFGNDSNL